MDQPIAMLWMRGSLSFVEQLCVRSFLDAGHHVILYGYEEIGRVPDGVERRDAALILPETGFLVHERTGSPALHSDLFRYRLLARGTGEIWADTDAYCLRPFRAHDGHLYGWESEHHVNGGVLGLPPDSATLAALLDFTSDEFAIPPWEKPWRRRELEAAKASGQPVHAGEQTWGVWGPHAITHFLKETGEIAHALPQAALYPYTFAERRKLLTAGVDHARKITDETQSIHLYGRRIRKRIAERDLGLPDPDSLLGGLLIKHRIDPCDAPLRDCPDPDRDHAFARRYREAVEGKQYQAAAMTGEIRPLDEVVAVTTMRNEGAFILDWVAYHLGVGVTHFLVYTNDCDDQTVAILDALAARGLVTRVDNPVSDGQKPQRQALTAAWSQPRVTAADAVVVMDVDEYINVHEGDGTLTDLFRAAGDPDMISMTWRLFGTSGHIAYEDAPAPERFTRCAPALTRKPHQAWGFKTILRRGAPFAGFGVHRPHDPTGPMPRWTNGSGAQLPDRYLDGGWRSGIDCWGYDLVTLNHYAVRSCESFLVKRDRGRSNHVARPQDVAYWNTYNRNDEVDASILPRLERARALREVFARDPGLGPLHEAAVHWHRARIDALKASPREAAFLAHVSADPNSHRLDEIALPEAPPVPRTVAAAPVSSLIELRDVAPPTGDEAARQFDGLMERLKSRQPLLPPLDAPPRSERIVVVTSMKNEGCFVLEWIAYHLSIGVTHFLVYTNDCDDPTDAVLDRLQALGHVTRVDNPFNRESGQKPQRGALNDAAERAVVRDADWVGIIDVDEFVNIHVGDGTFAALLEAANHPNVISMTWRFFGNRGVHAYEDRWQTEILTACAPLYIPKPRLGWGFKSFYRPDGPFTKVGVHRPLGLDPERADEVRWINGAGRAMPERVALKSEWFSRKDTIGYDMVTLNHYVLRSAESFLVKRQRGRINHVDQDQGVNYWVTRNYATETDTSIHARLPRARDVLVGLLADEDLFRLHRASVAWHRERIDELMRETEYRALYDAITDPSLPDAIMRAPKEKGDQQTLEAAE
ncbi:glycosyltransferase family 2 protein [Silicimonas algicola]|uniref:Glycosyl transferase family 2 n=1 Tax=Silicimonas algicola TaxID=1826607 RepID=A0A316GCA0_9RHOB|nr:glycosyltransferase family 2 protein [Silicimonas algicola]AZQ67755.1 glycosyltransferase family 2 protein [Silicimonas algicola]PWK57835.1 glycosyl transferase family 2 [Silicimonas algicola]